MNWYKQANKTPNELINLANDIANKTFSLLSRSEKEGRPISEEEALQRTSKRLDRITALTDVEREEILTYARLMVDQTFGNWEDYGYVNETKTLTSAISDYMLYYSYEYDSKNNKLKKIDLMKATSQDEVVTDANFLYNLYHRNKDIVMKDIQANELV